MELGDGQDIIEDLAFLEDDEGKIQQEKGDTQANKASVNAFKSRVFGLLLLFVEKAKDLTPLFDNLTEEIFLKEPEKVQELLNRLLNHGAITGKRLHQIGSYYKSLLLFRNSKGGQKITQGFVRVVRQLYAEDAEASSQLVQEMLQVFLTKRKCKLQAGFFQFLIRRLPQLKPSLLERCLTVEQNQKLRPAQERVLHKLKAQLVGKQSVKVEAEDKQEP